MISRCFSPLSLLWSPLRGLLSEIVSPVFSICSTTSSITSSAESESSVFFFFVWRISFISSASSCSIPLALNTLPTLKPSSLSLSVFSKFSKDVSSGIGESSSSHLGGEDDIVKLFTLSRSWDTLARSRAWEIRGCGEEFGLVSLGDVTDMTFVSNDWSLDCPLILLSPLAFVFCRFFLVPCFFVKRCAPVCINCPLPIGGKSAARGLLDTEILPP